MKSNSKWKLVTYVLTGLMAMSPVSSSAMTIGTTTNSKTEVGADKLNQGTDTSTSTSNQGQETDTSTSTSNQGQETDTSTSTSNQGQETGTSTSASNQGQETDTSTSTINQGQETMDDTSESSNTIISGTNNQDNDSSTSSTAQQQTNTSATATDISAHNIATGTIGTSNWELRDNGELHIGSGTITSYETVVVESPYLQYKDQITKVVIDGPITAVGHLGFCYGLDKVVEIQGLDKVDTSQVTNFFSAFQNMTSLKSIDLSSFDTSNVTNMWALFYGDVSLEAINLGNFNTSKVTDISYMFEGVGAQSVDMSSFDTSNVTDMQGMFYNALHMNSINVSNFDTSNVTNMRFMFYHSNVKTLDLSNFKTPKLTNMDSMFGELKSLESLNISNMDTSKVTNMNDTFKSNYSLDRLSLGSKFKFIGDSVDGLPEIEKQEGYSGKWINLNNGTITAPKGDNIWTSSEFMNNYDGSKDEDTYVWQPVGGDVTVKYIDKDGKPLDSDITLKGYAGDSYKTVKKEFEGYIFNEEQGSPENGKFSDAKQTVTYIYERKEAAPVTVKYLDVNGNKLADDVTLNGKVGLAYESKAKEIKDYTLKETQGNAKGLFSNAKQTVTYIYERKEAAPVTVKYLDVNGNKLADDVILNGKVGLAYESKAKEIKGYTLKETQGNAKGLFSNEKQTVTYIYKKNNEPTVSSEKPSNPTGKDSKKTEGHGGSNNQTSKGHGGSNNQKLKNKDQFPQTGENTTFNTVLTASGLLIIVLGGLLTYRFKIKK
ncbi:MucBP domain-containing protein [Enterococcus faecalis]